MTQPEIEPAGRRFRAFTAKHLDALVQRAGLSVTERMAIKAVGMVLPFRTNSYVVDTLIDWDAAPDDPMFRLVFPQATMLDAADVNRIACLLTNGAPGGELRKAVHEIRMRLNPHPAGQLALNVPELGEEPLPGVQHKYHETVLVFPKQGQTCHSYCTYCFRWAQFVDEPDLKMATSDIDRITDYLRRHGEVTSVRVGLFAHNPPVTRVVLDLRTRQNYQVFPSGNTVLVKLGSGVVRSAEVGSAQGAPVSAAARAGDNSIIGTVVSGNPQIRPMMMLPVSRQIGPVVSFQNGLLSVRTQKATLAQVLFEIHRLTGADIGVPAGAEREPVVADLGPGSPKEVLAVLLNGSNYNFIIMGSDGDRNVDRVILTPKSGGPMEQGFTAEHPEAVMAPSVVVPQAGAAAVIIPAPDNMPSDQDNTNEPPQP